MKCVYHESERIRGVVFCFIFVNCCAAAGHQTSGGRQAGVPLILQSTEDISTKVDKTGRGDDDEEG